MIICLNPDCQKPENPDGTNLCQSCGTGLVCLLRDRYRIISLLGSGGFGRTFMAEDTGMPSGRRCVIKQLKPIHNDPQLYQLVQERFKQEAAVLEKLGKGNSSIPKLYDNFPDSGLFYLVQEWIDGDTLTEVVEQKGTLSETDVVDFLTKVLEILDYVHSQNIIHRDIKPDNIIVRRPDNFPVLIDFGAVKETMGTIVTSHGTPTNSIAIGTPAYMPTEQEQGKPVYSSDLYSLGLTSIYALTGKNPQQLPRDQRTGEIIWHSYAQISTELRFILDKIIRVSQTKRYSRAKDILEALKAIRSPKTHTLPSWVFLGTVIGIAGIFGMAGIATSLFLNQHSSPLDSSSTTLSPSPTAAPSPTADSTLTMPSPMSADAYYNRGLDHYKLKNYQAALADYNKAIQLNPDYADAYNGRGNVYYELEDYQAALVDYNLAIQLKPDNTINYTNRGNVYKELGNYQAALADYNQAIKINRDYANAYTGRGNVYYDLGNYQAAMVDYNQAIQLKPDYVYAYYGRGIAYYKLGNYQMTLADYNKAIQLKPDYADAYNSRGIVYKKLGNYQAAMVDYNKAIQLKPDYARAYNYRGNVYKELGNYQAAMVDYNKTIKLKFDYADAYYNRGNLYDKLGDYQAALSSFQRARDLYQSQGNSEWYNNAINEINKLQNKLN